MNDYEIVLDAGTGIAIGNSVKTAGKMRQIM